MFLCEYPSHGEVEAPAADPHLRRNYALGVINGSLYTLAESLIDPALVLTWFLSRLSAPNVLIGLVVPLRDTGWFLPQLFLARHQARQPYKLPTYSAAALVRSIAWVTMSIVVLTQRDPTVLIVGFFVPYVINSAASGWGGLPFMDVVAKTIPARQRGPYFAARMLIGGALGIAGSLVVRLALGEQLGRAFPANVGQLIAIAGLFAVVSLFSFTFVVEPPGEVGDEVSSLTAHLGRAARPHATRPQLSIVPHYACGDHGRADGSAILCRIRFTRAGRGRGDGERVSGFQHGGLCDFQSHVEPAFGSARQSRGHPAGGGSWLEHDAAGLAGRPARPGAGRGCCCAVVVCRRVCDLWRVPVGHRRRRDEHVVGDRTVTRTRIVCGPDE